MIEYLVCLVTGGRWQVNGTNLEYICPQGGISELALIFSEYISYSDFVSLVRSKIGLLDKYRISLRFHHPELNYYIAIVEDMDVRMLINVMKCSGGRAVKVFVVVDEVEEVNGGSEIGNQLVGNLCSYKGSNDPIDITELQSNSDRDELGDEVKAKFPDNLFHGMPPVPAWPVDINEDIPTQMVDMNLQKIQCESIFKNKELLKRCIGKKMSSRRFPDEDK
ncbi:hypothetical protein Lser_V15G21271 [Lactuca serriola]